MIIRTKVTETLTQSVPNFKPEITFKENLRKKTKGQTGGVILPSPTCLGS